MYRLWLIIIPALILVGLWGLVTIKIKKVMCVTQFGMCPDYLQMRLPDLRTRKWIDGIAPTDLMTNFAGLPEVKKILVSKTIPGTVTVNITLRKPIGAVYSTANQAQVAADDQGWLFEVKDATNLPRLVVDSELTLGSQLQGDQFNAVNILYKASIIEQQNLSAKIVNGALEIKDPKGQLIVVSLSNSDIDWQYSLQAILTRSKIDGKVPQKIDLRFEDPVVVY